MGEAMTHADRLTARNTADTRQDDLEAAIVVQADITHVGFKGKPTRYIARHGKLWQEITGVGVTPEDAINDWYAQWNTLTRGNDGDR
jgi:hypothetical protein